MRQQSPDTIPLLAGFDHAFDFSAGGDTPFQSQDIALSVRPYAGQARYDTIAAWDSAFGYLADRYPIVHIDAAATAQAGMYAYFKCDATIVDTTGYNEAAFDGNIAQGQSFSFVLGRNVADVFYGCFWNLTGQGAASYVVDLLHPDWCGPTNCFDMQADGAGFNNAWSASTSSTDIEADSFTLRTTSANPFATGGQIGTSTCPDAGS